MKNIKPKLVAFTSLTMLFSFFGCMKENTQVKLPEVTEISIEEIHEGYKSDKFTVLDIIHAYLERIEKIDNSGPELNSIIAINPNLIETAEILEKERKEGKMRGLLHGIPIVIKDNIDTRSMPTTAGSKALENSYPPDDASIIERLEDAGAIILGKANLSEWANFRGRSSTSGWSGLGGLTKNPYVLDRNPCGSSAGSGVAVSANLCVVAIGTETNGSIVCPSHANGIVGIKPTVGLVSRDGIIPISYTQDTPGPMARSVSDAAILLNYIVGPDSADQKTLTNDYSGNIDYTKFLHKDGLRNKRIGIYTRPLGNDFKVDSLFNKAVKKIQNAGAIMIEIDNISPRGTGGHSFQVMLHEYKSGLNQYFSSLGQNAPVRNIEELIEFNKNDSTELQYFNQVYLEMASKKKGIESTEYLTSLNELLSNSRKNGLDKVLEANKLDAIIAPTGGPAWKTDLINGDNFSLGSSSPAAHAGYPNITVPMGYIEELPVGISFFGKAWSEPKLIEIAYSFEQLTNSRRTPQFLPH